MATLVSRPPVAVGHTLTEPANSHDILHCHYTVTLPPVYLNSGHSYTFSATICVQSVYVDRPKDFYNFCGILCMGRNPHSLAERAAVHPTSIISLQVWEINWNVLETTGYCISRRCSLTGLCSCCPVPLPVPALWTAPSHKWEWTVKCLHCRVVSTRTALFWAITQRVMAIPYGRLRATSGPILRRRRTTYRLSWDLRKELPLLAA
jgi:hypothetical protein